MALKIRLRQQGRTNHLAYRLVVADSRLPRDGKYLEKLGWYDPNLDPDATIVAERVQYWLDQGAVLTPKAEALIARLAPEVIRAQKAKEVEKQNKLRAKRKAAKKAKAA